MNFKGKPNRLQGKSIQIDIVFRKPASYTCDFMTELGNTIVNVLEEMDNTKKKKKHEFESSKRSSLQMILRPGSLLLSDLEIITEEWEEELLLRLEGFLLADGNKTLGSKIYPQVQSHESHTLFPWRINFTKCGHKLDNFNPRPWWHDGYRIWSILEDGSVKEEVEPCSVQGEFGTEVESLQQVGLEAEMVQMAQVAEISEIFIEEGPCLPTNRFVDVEEILEQKEKEGLDLTGSMLMLFGELASTSGGISLSSGSAKLLLTKMEQIDEGHHQIKDSVESVKEQNLKLLEKIEHLENENEQLKTRQEEVQAKHGQDIDLLRDEMAKLRAEMESSRQKVTKKIKMDIPLSSSQIIKKVSKGPGPLNEEKTEKDLDLSSSVLSMFPLTKSQNKPLFEKIEEGVKEKMEEEEEKLEVQVSVNESWRIKLELRILGKVEGNSNPKLVYYLDDEIIDTYLNLYQQQDLFCFKVSTAAAILGRGSSKLRYDENYLKSKYIMAPISIQEKEGKHWSLLLISNDLGNWKDGPNPIEAFHYDSKGYAEPKDSTKKVLKYLLECKKRKQTTHSIDFDTEISAKKIPVPKEENFQDSGFHVLYHLREISLHKKKYLPSKKSINLALFRQDLFNSLLYCKS